MSAAGSAGHREELRIGVVASREVHRFDRSATVGRDASNDVVVDDPYVSGHHAEIRRTGLGWELRDLGSTNGTFVEGERVERSLLTALTRVHLGHPSGPELRVRISEVAADGRDAAPPEASGDAAPSDDSDDAASSEASDSSSVLGRYLAEEDPEGMSRRTGLIRAAFRQQREERRHARRQTRAFQVVAAVLLVVALAAGAYAYAAHRRAEAQRAAAADLFHTMKSLELELRRLQGPAGGDPSFRRRLEVLDRQYEELVRTLDIYSEDTPEEVRLVYRVVHKFGESEVGVPEEFVREVLRYVERWRDSRLPRFIRRAERHDYGRRIARTLLEHNLPPEFFYLALQESGLDTAAVGPPTRFGHAKGMWQFIPQTAENYGLAPGPLQGEPRPDPLDDRHDFEKSTRAAARYLFDIYTTDAQASGLLVMASYNWGERNVLRLIRSMPATPRERNFWNLLERHRERLPEETYDYVLRIVSAAVIGENPGLFGFDFGRPLPRVEEDGEPAGVGG